MRTLTRHLTLAALVVAGLGFASAACRRTPDAGPGSVTAKAQYHCPMHPTFVSDRPGECRICGMKLVPMEAGSPAPARSVLYYRSPMDPSVHSATPTKDSMGMDFVPVYAGRRSGLRCLGPRHVTPGAADPRGRSEIIRRAAVRVIAPSVR
jgi:hypothetical protein